MGTKSLALYIISIAKVMKIHTKPRKVPDLDTPIITKSLVGVSIDMNKSRTQSRKALLRNKGIKIPLYKVLSMKSTSLLRALRKVYELYEKEKRSRLTLSHLWKSSINATGNGLRGEASQYRLPAPIFKKLI